MLPFFQLYHKHDFKAPCLCLLQNLGYIPVGVCQHHRKQCLVCLSHTTVQLSASVQFEPLACCGSIHCVVMSPTSDMKLMSQLRVSVDYMCLLGLLVNVGLQEHFLPQNGQKKLCTYTTNKMSVMNFHLQLSWGLDIVSIASVRINHSFSLKHIASCRNFSQYAGTITLMHLFCVEFGRVYLLKY